MTVPKVIHQTWKSEVLPPAQAEWQHTVRAEHPDHEHVLWTDAHNRALIADDYPWFLPTYDSYAHDIERVDAVRYFILHSRGGLYLDLDMEVFRPLDTLLGPGLTFSMEAGPMITQTVTSNALMAAPPRHPFYDRLIRRLPAVRRTDVTHQDIFENTGPNMLAAELAAWGGDDITILGLDLVCPVGVISQNPALEAPTLEAVREQRTLAAVHHNTETWNVQLPTPVVAPDGYVLFRNSDLPGHDRAYVQCHGGDISPLVDRCSADDDAIGFNYNGFLKSRGASLEPALADGVWFKPGIEPWVCVKTSRLGSLDRTGSPG